jgi:hypothetical protein
VSAENSQALFEREGPSVNQRPCSSNHQQGVDCQPCSILYQGIHRFLHVYESGRLSGYPDSEHQGKGGRTEGNRINWHLLLIAHPVNVPFLHGRTPHVTESRQGDVPFQ